MKQHYSRYTPEMVTRITGTPPDHFLKVCELIAETAAPDKVMTIMYALGWTQHTTGAQIIRTMAMIQLLLGNIGRPGGGVNALRGHANVQGITDQNLITDTLPGYIKLGRDKEQELTAYLEARTPKLLRPNQMNYGQNTPKFFVSLMKAWFGAAATAENDFGYHWLPKIDKPYDVLHMFERMHQGQMNGFICQGFNPLAAVVAPRQGCGRAVEPEVPRGHGSARHRDVGVLEERRRVQQRQDGRDQDGGVPPADGVLRRGRRHVHQLRPRDRVEGEGRGPAGRRQERPRDHGAAVPRAERPLREGRRRVPGADLQGHLELRACARHRRRRNS